MKTIDQLIEEAGTNKGFKNFGASFEILPNGSRVQCSVRIAVTGGSVNRETTRTEWSVNGKRKSKAVCAALLGGN